MDRLGLTIYPRQHSSTPSSTSCRQCLSSSLPVSGHFCVVSRPNSSSRGPERSTHSVRSGSGSSSSYSSIYNVSINMHFTEQRREDPSSLTLWAPVCLIIFRASCIHRQCSPHTIKYFPIVPRPHYRCARVRPHYNRVRDIVHACHATRYPGSPPPRNKKPPTYVATHDGRQ